MDDQKKCMRRCLISQHRYQYFTNSEPCPLYAACRAALLCQVELITSSAPSSLLQIPQKGQRTPGPPFHIHKISKHFPSLRQLQELNTGINIRSYRDTTSDYCSSACRLCSDQLAPNSWLSSSIRTSAHSISSGSNRGPFKLLAGRR